MEKMPGSTLRWGARVASLLAALALAACGGGGGGGGGSSDAGQGTLQVHLTDAPSCYEHVYVTVQKVRVNTSSTAADGDGGWQDLTLATPKKIDLLDLTNGVLEDLGTTTLPAGSYQQVRLVLADNGGSDPLANSVQAIGGQLVALKTPSGQQSGLKLPAHFDVQANQVADLLLDFDACKSIVKAGNSGSYILKPVISVTPLFTASIQGYVTSTLAISATSVSAQQDGGVVRSTTPDASGKFTLAYLPNGTYTVVITSDAHATGVITSIPVSTTTGVTTVNGTATALVLPASPMASVSGGVTATNAPVTDATVNALQDLTGGPTVLVKSVPVDADLGTYTMSLPVAAPVKAPYASTGLIWTPDTAAAGKYRIDVSAPGRAAQDRPASLAGGNQMVNFSY